ncbi:hypothetical protein [Aquipuribacter sp. SD81]|uniref:hypothetical protein n=1 Tax=Aquipuribacter sp. SD81 TaxID=3127703 RepID=UPI00301752CA
MTSRDVAPPSGPPGQPGTGTDPTTGGPATRYGRWDVARAVAVAVTALAQVLGSPLGAALPGASDVGAVSDRWQTVITPAGSTFAVWGVIFAGCLAYAVYQALPAQLARDVHRRAGWPLAVAFAANTAFELVFPQDGTAVLVGNGLVVLSVVAAGVAVARLQVPPTYGVARVLPGVVAPLLLGWVTFATVANVALSGVLLGAPDSGGLARAAGIVALVAAAAVVLDVGLRLRGGTTAFVLPAAWGAYGVTLADPPFAVAVAAWVALAVMLLAVPVQLYRTRDVGRVLLS